MTVQSLARLSWPVLVAGALVAAAAAPSAPPPLDVAAVGATPGRAASAFRLFAGARNVLIAANRVSCNVNNVGNACVSPTGSPVVGGGFWPRGTNDQYIFSGGLQVAGIIPSNAGFAWAGDTIGAFFLDPRGIQQVGETVSGLFDSRQVRDLLAWPPGAYAGDTALFDPSLAGRRAISDQDTWVRYWDVSPNTRGREHLMGLVVDQRTLAFNRPWADRDIVYFIYRLINATARDPAAYEDLAAAGYTAGDIVQIAALGAQFQATAEVNDPGVSLPAGGFTYSNLYVGYYQDPDIGQGGYNFATASLPFAMGIAYKADFSEPTWAYPADVFTPPTFAHAPGFTGLQFVGLATDGGRQAPQFMVWSNTASSLPDPVGVAQLYRYLSGTNSGVYGDRACNSRPLVNHVCSAVQAPMDTRQFASTGPFTLQPGHSLALAVAIVQAAPVDSEPASGSGIYALSAFGLSPYVTPQVGTMAPGWPATAESLAVYGSVSPGGMSYVRPIERAAGWASYSDANGDGRIEPSEVQTVPYSLLHKAQVAQAVFENKFLVPQAPEPPLFFAVPGDGKVTIAWQKSATEAIGDPYFPVASQPLSPLYDPDYRRFDVEGYRVWRGRSTGDLRLVAQFDYAGTTFLDYTGQVWAGDNCAPDLGITAGCPGFPVSVPLAGSVIQIPPAGRTLLSNGAVAVLRADTAVTGGGSGMPALTDCGVPFVFVDQGLENGFTYFYSVTAFDVNSIVGGVSSLESPMVAKAVTPRVMSSNAQAAQVVTGLFGADGTPLDPTVAWPAIDPATGTFSGPIPPSNGVSLALLAGVPEAMPPGDYSVRLDSIGPGFVGGIGTTPDLYLSIATPADAVRRVFSLPIPAFSSDPRVRDSVSAALPLIPYDSSRVRRLGLTFTQDVRMLARFSLLVTPLSTTSVGNAVVQGRYGVPGGAAAAASQYLLHSRWLDEGGEEPAQPTIDPYGSASHSNGALTGVSLIYSPLPYRVAIGVSAAEHQISVNARGVAYAAGAAWYPADFVVTWGTGGAIAVRDSTHRTELPFKKSLEVGWGFVNERTFAPAGIAASDLDDGTGAVQLDVVGYHHLYGIYPVCDPTWWGIRCAPLDSTAELESVDWTNDGAPDGTGIVLLINGEPFIMAMSSLPAPGTRWHLRAVGGDGLSAACTPGLPTSLATVPSSCSGYGYAPPGVRPAYAPGLRATIRVTQGFEVASASGDLQRVHTVPDPYYLSSAYETTPIDRQLRFVNLPDRAIIRIYSSSGILATILQHNDPTGGGEEPWDLKSRNGHVVASGVYFYQVEGPDGRGRVGRFTIVNRGG
jgi:hypothetical protein